MLNKKETVLLRVRKDVGLVTELNRCQDPARRGFDASLLSSHSFLISVSCTHSPSTFVWLCLASFCKQTDSSRGKDSRLTSPSSQPRWDSADSLVSHSLRGQCLCPKTLGTLIGQARVIWLKGMG